MSMELVRLWVKQEPFCCAVLPVAPHPKLHPEHIKKIIPYLRSKSKHFPYCSYKEWRHICCDKLHIEEEYAEMQFCMFLNNTRKSSEASKREDVCLNSSPSHQKYECDGRSFHVLKFVLMLTIQQINKIRLRSFSVSACSSKEWPSSREKQLHAKRSSCKVGLMNRNEQNQLSFLIGKLEELIDLVNYNDHSSMINRDAIDALSFLIEGQIVGSTRPVMTLSDIAVMNDVRNQSGYNLESNLFHYQTFVTWIKQNLIQNAFGMLNVKTSGRILSWLKHDNLKDVKRRGNCITNAHKAPKCRKIVVLNKICKVTLARSSKTLEGSSISIIRSNNAFIYLLSSLRCCSIEKCQNSLIMLGPVKSVNIIDCQDCTVIVATRQIVISDCVDCTFHLISQTRPILAGNKNSNLIIAPYNTFYPSLSKQMTKVGIDVERNKWNEPINIASNGALNANSTCWKLIDPTKFHVFEVPFHFPENFGDDSRSIPIPEPYKSALIERDRSLESWYELLRKSKMTNEQRNDLQKCIQSHFQTWLKNSGHYQEIESLASLVS